MSAQVASSASNGSVRNNAEHVEPHPASALLSQIGTDPKTGIETTFSLFAFTAENEDELSFPANDIIQIIEKDHEYNDGWYRGRNSKGEEGLFPASYVLPPGADPTPYMEMQQAPQPLNLSSSGSGSALGLIAPESPIKGIDRRPSSPGRSLARSRSNSLIETKNKASEGKITGPHAAESEITSPAEQAAVLIPPVSEDKVDVPVTDKVLTHEQAIQSPKSVSTEEMDKTITQNEHDGRPSLDDNLAQASMGGNNIRARLAEQARLENEKIEQLREEEEEGRRRTASDASATLGSRPVSGATSKPFSFLSNGRTNQPVSGVRMSGGGVPHGLVYSDESDSEDESSVVGGLGSPKRNANQRLGFEEEEADKGFSFGGLGGFGKSQANPATTMPVTIERRPSEPFAQHRVLEQITEKSTPLSTPNERDLSHGLQPAVDITPYSQPQQTPPLREIEPPLIIADAPQEAPAYFPTPPHAAVVGLAPPSNTPPKEESPLGTPFVQPVYLPISPPKAIPAQIQEETNGFSQVQPPVQAPVQDIAPSSLPQPASMRKLSEDVSPGISRPQSGVATPNQPGSQPDWQDAAAGDPRSWGVVEVLDWARRKGFDESICGKFEEHEITGDVLLELDVNLLKELEIPQFGKRVKIANAIAELRRPQSAMSGAGVSRGVSIGGPISPAGTAQSYPASPTYGYDISRNSLAGGVHQSIPEHQAISPDGRGQDSYENPAQLASRPQSQQQPQPPFARQSSGPTTPGSATYGEWGHSRKSSVNPSLNAPVSREVAVIEEAKRGPIPVHQNVTPEPPMANMLPSTNVSQRATSIRSSASSVPTSPQTTMNRRSSVEQRAGFGHKKAKSSVDGSRPPSERMSFFGGTLGRNRKPAPRYPSNASTLNVGQEESIASSGPDRQRSLSRLVGGNTNRLTKSSIGGPQSAPAGGNQRISVGTVGPTSPLRNNDFSQSGANEGSALSQIGRPDYAGYMKKKGERYNTWKSRYFVLKGSHLYYMKSPQEDKVKGHIDLAGYKVFADPNGGSGFGFQITHDREKAHSFASNEHQVIKEWMKNLMKATISRDYSAPVVSSCNIPTIPLREAQMLAPRPPSPGERAATQRAARRDNPNQLTPRDASVLMSLKDGPVSPQRNGRVSQQTRGAVGLGGPPGRPSRDMRRPSDRQGSTASFYQPEDDYPAPRAQTNHVAPIAAATTVPVQYNQQALQQKSASHGDDAVLIQWINEHLPAGTERATNLTTSFASGLLITRLIETYCHPESSSAIPADGSTFMAIAPGEPNLEGLFTMMDKCIDEGVDTAGVSINDVRLGMEEETRRLLISLRGWVEARERA